MNKFWILLLAALLLVSSVGCSGGKTDGKETLPPPEPAEMPYEYHFSPTVELELEGEPVYEDGIFTLVFTEHQLSYDSDSVASVGLISDTSASSLDAEIVSDGTDWTVPHDGVRIRMKEPIPAGTYTVSVAFGRYKINFDMSFD